MKTADKVRTNCRASSTGVQKSTNITSYKATETKKLPGQKSVPCTKIKLQLFPIDEDTRTGLEKDGHHPFLELSLRPTKKISSVLKHLNTKWGCSSVAHQNPTLFPYNRLGRLSNCLRWTLKDYNITAEDVYTAVGSPFIFRLRYGWSSALTPHEICLQSEGKLKGQCTAMENLLDNEKQIEVMKDFKSEDENVTANIPVAEKISNEAIDHVDTEPLMNYGVLRTSILDMDGLTNRSVGGLLSGASDNWEDRVIGSTTSLQPTHLISDSFDQFIASRTNCPQGSEPPNQEPGSSILDAEETCHAFFLSNRSSSSSKANALKEFKTDLSLCSQAYHDESSLGLTGIKWCDSLGPFDIGLSTSRMPASGENSISMSGFVR